MPLSPSYINPAGLSSISLITIRLTPAHSCCSSCFPSQAWRIYRSLDVEYVFVVFGGVIGYPSDDINKFLWMVS